MVKGFKNFLQNYGQLTASAVKFAEKLAREFNMEKHRSTYRGKIPNNYTPKTFMKYLRDRFEAELGNTYEYYRGYDDPPYTLKLGYRLRIDPNPDDTRIFVRFAIIYALREFEITIYDDYRYRGLL